MPMYTGGQVLDLETAVKDGILGGDGGGVICSDVTTPNLVKLDLKKMIKQLDSIGEVDVPTVFICPISLEPMQDPVTLCTGQKPFHLVGSEAIAILVNLELNFDCIANLLQPNKISLMVDVLNDGSTETKINCVRLMETLFNGS
ncbi:putative U box domain, Zinc finger, RING/FYVE/PHD-type [Helianthus anomalus]